MCYDSTDEVYVDSNKFSGVTVYNFYLAWAAVGVVKILMCFIILI